MINEIFYTFSTIAQTLAGAIALMAAIVLFRLQSLNADIDGMAESLASSLNLVSQEKADKALTFYRLEDFRGLMYLYNSEVVNMNNIPFHAKLYCERLPKLLSIKSLFLFWFKMAFYLTLFLVLFAVFVLAFAETIAGSRCCAQITFIIGFAWLFGCLFSYAALMHQSLK